jgi:hypothetical protein
MTTIPFYRQQAEREQREAHASVLDHVRDRHVRAAQAWTVLADPLQHTAGLRDARDKARLVAEALGQSSYARETERRSS